MSKHNTLKLEEQIQVVDFLRSHPDASTMTMDEAVTKTAEFVGFAITHSNMRNICKGMKITFAHRRQFRARRPTDHFGRQATLAKILRQVVEELGMKLDPNLQAEMNLIVGRKKLPDEGEGHDDK